MATRGMHQGGTPERTMPTMIELAVLAQVIDNMVSFSSKGEMFINGLPVAYSQQTYALAVHTLTAAILE